MVAVVSSLPASTTGTCCANDIPGTGTWYDTWYLVCLVVPDKLIVRTWQGVDSYVTAVYDSVTNVRVLFRCKTLSFCMYVLHLNMQYGEGHIYTYATIEVHLLFFSI